MKLKMRRILVALCVLFLLWGTVFLVDYTRATSLKAPIFALSLGVTADDGGSGVYYGLGYTVAVEKYLDADHGACIRSVEMRVLGHVIAASIT